MRRALVLAALAIATVSGVGCGESSEAGDRPIVHVASDYFPATVGDRVRMRVEPGRRFEHVGVTARDADGRVVVGGTDRTTIAFHRVARDAVWMVSPGGTDLVPTIVGPIRVGTTTRYAVTQGAAAGRCVLAIRAVDRPVTAAGVRFEGCVAQERRCELPAGGGLPTDTVITEDETLCPRVGLVKRRFRADPPLPFQGVPADETSELVAFVVAGAPSLPASASIADRLILLPSDVAAACGGVTGASELRERATRAGGRPLPDLIVPPDARDDDALLAFQLAESRLLVEARPGSGDLERYRVAPLADGTVPSRIAFATPRALVRITGAERCPNASGYGPLLASLLR